MVKVGMTMGDLQVEMGTSQATQICIVELQFSNLLFSKFFFPTFHS